MGVDEALPAGARYAYRKMRRMHARPLYAHADGHAHAHAAAIATTDALQVPSLLRERYPGRTACTVGGGGILPTIAIARQRSEALLYAAPSDSFDCAHDEALWARAPPSVSPGGPSHRLFPWPASLPGAMHVNSTTATLNPQRTTASAQP